MSRNKARETEVDAIEYGGITYAIIKEFLVRSNTYFHLVNIDDPLDFIYQKLKIEDGEECLVDLSSEREFKIVMAYEQKYIWRDLKQKKNSRRQQMAIDFDLPICIKTGTLYVVFKAVSFVLEVSMAMKTKLRKLSLRIFTRKLKQLFDKKT